MYSNNNRLRKNLQNFGKKLVFQYHFDNYNGSLYRNDDKKLYKH